MDILKAEIERKRKQLESRSLIQPQKKFFKREELIQKWDEEYHQKMAAKYGLKEQSTANENDDSESGTQDNQQSSSDPNSDQKSNERILPRKEVIKRLRERNEPIILFGETEIEAFRRLRKLEVLEPESNDRGFRNDFQVGINCLNLLFFDIRLILLSVLISMTIGSHGRSGRQISRRDRQIEW